MASTSTKKTSSTTKKKTTSSKASTSVKRKAKSTLASEISSASGLDKKVVSQGLNQVSKLSTGGKIAVALCFVLGIAGGYVGIRLVQKNDQFRLINGENYSVNVGDSLSFDDLSDYVICISYSMNAINSVSYEIKDENNNVISSIDTASAGNYSVTYTSSNIKYKNITLTQTISVSPSENSYND